ncbi:hypothetical protein [Halodesulfovibrio sp.]|jgi:hypothetical protein|uniref:hypothetical protein n=1 Tax=Halodesulfovibrio sp. TaxID=1912772 RepID=UPI0025DE9DF7|nr:hypothetical protein [Halodesulfovibrio sp.]MCT4627934.1 hypothetical protein [Halodesulfovibrio sp.]
MYKLVPYASGNFSDSIIRALYHRVVDEGLHSTLFYDGCITSADTFLETMQRIDTHLFILFANAEPAALVWLNRHQMRFMQFHFCVFRKFWGKAAREFAPKILSALVTLEEVGGGYILDSLMGIVPQKNKLACRYVTKWGRVAGCLPLGAYNAQTKESEPALIISFTREDIPEGLEYESLFEGGAG